ncbi:MAPEG family protein [Alcanivorax sp. 1008]|uniref:MAPEG family protein n=1 Tax=Alcanivorax sp. 1008 TaxID=2816853 RepID=UPI001D3E9DA7|nr:MAPEG family protein [Alcanivorax sp. 1008]MCC1496215.1 MAPEG family protein [Alcanivorax sp. 1008]
MTIAYWCVLVAIFLPYAFTFFAKFHGDFGPKQNHNPREFLEKLTGSRKRAHWAQLNSFEVNPAFFAAVVIAQQIGSAAQGTIDALAIGFVVSRALFGILYITDKALLRTLVWSAGMATIVALFVVSA